jgi:hypothetical protein
MDLYENDHSQSISSKNDISKSLNHSKESLIERKAKKFTTNTKSFLSEINNQLETVQIKDEEEPENQIIKNMREDFFKEIKRKEDEIKTKKTLPREKEIKKSEIIIKLKEFDGRKLTSDVNGSPLQIKNVVTDKLQKDFGIARSDVFYLDMKLKKKRLS